MKTLTQIIQIKLIKKMCLYYLVLMLLVQHTQGNQSVFSYKTNQLPFSYNAQTGLNHVPVHPYQQPQAQVQQQTYLTLPFLQNYSGNLRKKPSTSSAFIFNKNTKHKHHAINSNTNANHHHSNNNNNNNINMHMYSKRYKRYPPFQTMPEIPIKKAIGRYLPYAPIYPMGVMTPSILLPLYVAPAKATARIILKPSVVDLASTSAANIKQTKLNKSLLLNYLRLTNDKKNLHKSLTTNTTAMPTSITTTTSTASTTIGNYVVDSHIKFYDTPYSASNIQQQQLKQHYYNNLYNNNYATHFLLPIMPAKTTTTTTTTAATYIPTASTNTENHFKRMPASFYERGQIVNDKGDYEFLPTWYSYGKPQAKKYSNFFTIEDAITPYKPIEPLTIGYQPSYFYENTQTENYAHIKPTNSSQMQFSPIHATVENVTTITTTATTTTDTTTTGSSSNSRSTVSSFLEELSREASKWNLFSNEKDDTTSTTKQLASTVGTLKIEEISLTTTARNLSKLERALKMAENVEPYRIRTSTTAATNISPKSMKKVLRTKSFFDDWFSDANSDESVETTTHIEKILTTTPLTEMDDRYHKLKWPTKRRNQNTNRTTTSTTTPPTTMNSTRGILKKPRKKYGNPKPNKLNRNFTSKENTELKRNSTTKFVKRIKKVLRVRPTLFSTLKLQNKNIDEQIDRPLQAMDMTPTQIIENSMEDNEQVTFAPKMLITTTTTTTTTTVPTTTSTTTTTTTTSTANKTAMENAERTRFGGMQRKRGRHSYNSQMNQSTTAATFMHSERQERIEANKKSRQTHGRQRSTTTTTTATTTTSTTTSQPKNHRHELEILPVLKKQKDGSSTTMESAIMKIARNKRINNILENLLVTSSTSPTPLSDGSTEYPQLPIELYFQKIKAGFK